MSVADTKPIEKTCSKCLVSKTADLFISKRNICKTCRNNRSKEIYNTLELNNETEQECNVCNNTKSLTLFVKNRKICTDCNNNKRRAKYNSNEEHRVKLIQRATEFKQKKITEKKQIKEDELGLGNIKCNYCNEIKLKENFRRNRLKCKDCEREEPISKIIRSVRSRIFSAIKFKSKHTISYLGCNCLNYLKWILNNNQLYTFENHGKEWHIDHVIPLSKFDLENENEQLIAFNWRNTMPLSVKENLSKNNKIIKEQIENHYKKLLEYHLENKLDLPQVFIDVFAKHLVAGSPLEPI